MEQAKIIFGIVGSGWRAECYLRVASLLPERFQVAGVVARRESRRVELEARWNVPMYDSIDEFLDRETPDFLVTSVSKDSGPSVIKELAARSLPVLAETPPANSFEALLDLYRSVGSKAAIQVAEQYHVQPMHAARLALLKSGKLGAVHYADVSISHGYHAISLMRKMLGIGFENAVIQAKDWELPVIEGPGRQGPPTRERLIRTRHVVASLDFGDKVGLYDFENNQHRSWIRSQRILARGERGEIHNTSVKYLADFLTPIEFELRRQTAGECENLEGFYLKGILGGESWLYTNPFIPARFSDDDIAIATCLLNMQTYLKEGIDFYSLADAAQDQYLALMLEAALRQQKPLRTETQIWAV